MVVGRDYMLKQRSGPSAPKLFFDTRVVPAVVNMLGTAEVVLDRAAVRTGVSATGLLAGAVTLGVLGGAWLLLRASPEPV